MFKKKTIHRTSGDRYDPKNPFQNIIITAIEEPDIWIVDKDLASIEKNTNHQDLKTTEKFHKYSLALGLAGEVMFARVLENETFKRYMGIHKTYRYSAQELSTKCDYRIRMDYDEDVFMDIKTQITQHDTVPRLDLYKHHMIKLPQFEKGEKYRPDGYIFQILNRTTGMLYTRGWIMHDEIEMLMREKKVVIKKRGEKIGTSRYTYTCDTILIPSEEIHAFPISLEIGSMEESLQVAKLLEKYG